MSALGSQPAYPHVCKILQVHEDGTMTTQPLTQGGMTKRELFAAMAMQGMMANGELAKVMKSTADGAGVRIDDMYAIMAVGQADALLRKLEEAK